MSNLTFYPVTDTHELVHPEEFARYSLASPAAQFFTDFYNVEPKVILSSVTAQQALDTMIKTHVRMMIVIDEQKQFLGIVTAHDVAEQKILSAAALQHEKPNEILLTDLMQRRKDLLALSVDDIQGASINEVINFLKENTQRHCLVIDPIISQIRGIFSASDISRKLQLPLNIQGKLSFNMIYNELNKEKEELIEQQLAQ